jgi:hypothetical protein
MDVSSLPTPYLEEHEILDQVLKQAGLSKFSIDSYYARPDSPAVTWHISLQIEGCDKPIKVEGASTPKSPAELTRFLQLRVFEQLKNIYKK